MLNLCEYPYRLSILILKTLKTILTEVPFSHLLYI